MKRLTASLFAAVLIPGVVWAGGPNGSTASEMSAYGGLSVFIGSAAVITSPVVLVADVVDASVKSSKTSVRVRTEKGETQTIDLPKDTVAKAQLKPGDRLTVKPVKAGTILSKGDEPIAFMVPPENANLAHSHELAR